MAIGPARDAIGPIEIELDPLSLFDIAQAVSHRLQAIVHRRLGGIVGREDDIGPGVGRELGKDRARLSRRPHLVANLCRAHRFGLALKIHQPPRQPGGRLRQFVPPYRCINAAIGCCLISTNRYGEMRNALRIRLSNKQAFEKGAQLNIVQTCDKFLCDFEWSQPNLRAR
jgi:hypothetical protein